MKTLREVRNEHILNVLTNTNWDIAKASKILKISEGFLKKEIEKIRHLEKKNIQGFKEIKK